MVPTIDRKLLDEIVRRVLGTTSPDRIIMFGSAASGKMTQDSDIDLLVILKSVRNAREDQLVIRRALRGLGVPFDVIVISADRFEETKQIVGAVAYPANKYGKVIYEAA